MEKVKCIIKFCKYSVVSFIANVSAWLIKLLLIRTRIPPSCQACCFSVGHQLADKFNHGMRHWREQNNVHSVCP